MINLQELPNEILEAIFDYCDETSLQNVYKTCKKFKQIVSYHKYWLSLAKESFATNQISDFMTRKCLVTLSPFEKCRLSNNWLIANYEQSQFLKMPQNYMPCLQLDENHLWVGFGKTIKSYSRSIIEKFMQGEHWLRKPRHDHVLGDTQAKGDASRFRRSRNLIIYNQDDNLCCYDIAKKKYVFKRDISSIFRLGEDQTSPCNGWKTNDALDFQADSDVVAFKSGETVFVTALQNFKKSKISSLNVWNRNCWRLRLSDCGKSLVGAAKDGLSYLYDVESGGEIAQFGGKIKSNTVVDICWQSPTVFLTGGYDSVIRLWDTRCLSTNFETNRAEIEMGDPFNSAIYCLSSDKNNSLLVGMQMNARVNACDIRNQRFLQIYYMGSKLSSPIYSLDFEPRQMFAATAKEVHILDFSTFNNPVTILNIRGVSVGYKNDHRTWLK